MHFNVEKDSNLTITNEDIVTLNDYMDQESPDKFTEDLTVSPRETNFLTIIVPKEDDPSFPAVREIFVNGKYLGLFFELARIRNQPIPGGRPMYRH